MSDETTAAAEGDAAPSEEGSEETGYQVASPSAPPAAAEPTAPVGYSEDNPNHEPSPFDYDDRSMFPGEEVRRDYVQHPPHVTDTLDTSREGLPNALEHLPAAGDVANLPEGGYVATSDAGGDVAEGTKEMGDLPDGASATPEEAPPTGSEGEAAPGEPTDSGDGLDAMDVDQLREIAANEQVPSHTAMDQDQLVVGIREHRAESNQS